MADETKDEGAANESAPEETLTKAQLQRRMEETRESISQTVEEIRETVAEQYETVKETVGGVLDYREQFQQDPLVWSVGALSAGFALGYTLGYAHKNTHGAGHKHSALAAFADTLVDELSTVGRSLVMPTLNLKIKELFGFDFSEMLEEMGQLKESASGHHNDDDSQKRESARRSVKASAATKRKNRAGTAARKSSRKSSAQKSGARARSASKSRKR